MAHAVASRVQADAFAALCVFAGSLLRPLVGFLADCFGGITILSTLDALAMSLLLGFATTPALPAAVLLLFAITGSRGWGAAGTAKKNQGNPGQTPSRRLITFTLASPLHGRRQFGRIRMRLREQRRSSKKKIMADLSSIDTIVVVIMENRSFDHLLGYLNLPAPNRIAVEGLESGQEWLRRFANPGPPNDFMYQATPLRELHVADPPHERSNIAVQLGTPDDRRVFPMKGFINSAGGNSQVMQYYTADTVPVTDFFAHNFAVCDHWFAPLPAGTQANRLMAMSGQSYIDTNVSNPVEFPDQQLVYDWLKQRGVRWRVYHQGFFPFFAMMPRWYPQMLASDDFRRFERLKLDFELEPDSTFPNVVFVEPKYTDSPHIGEGTDDHSPSSVLGGQALLLDIYNALISNPVRWRKTVMILTYDEHGGFFDHVQPLPITTKDPRGRYPDFISSGVRVPAIVISPLVSPGAVYNKPLDHTSILRFIGQKFGGRKYGPGVDDRPYVGSVLDVLDLNAPRQLIPPAPDPSVIPDAQPYVRGFKTQTENVKMFQDVTHQLTTTPQYRHALATKFPEFRDFLGI